MLDIVIDPYKPAIGTLFVREHVETQPCPTCAEPVADTSSGPVHWEALPNGARTAYAQCRTGYQGALFGVLDRK